MDGQATVLQNRLSWNKYDKIRINNGLEPTPSRKRAKRHEEKLNFDKENLLTEAQTWNENMPINWSTLATEHGVTGGNKGQVVKEFLAQHNVKPAPRRSKKRLPGGRVSLPMQKDKT